MIAIRLVSQAGGVPAAPLQAVFGQAGGDIGRASDCTLVLPDPERRISRKHLQIGWRDSRHFLRLISTNLLVELDGVPLTPGIEFALNPGAQIRIGPFVLAVTGTGTAGASQAGGAASKPAAEPVGDDAFALFGAPRQVGKPSIFHDLLHPAQLNAGVRAPASKSQEVDLLLGGTGSDWHHAAPAASPPSGPGPGPGQEPPLRSAPADDLILALFAGLGVAAPEPAARSAAQMELIGALLRSTLSGTLGLLAARGIAKRELGASPTLVQTRQNNPLKFSADVDAAVVRLLEPPQRGFIPALAAVRESFDDLRAHQVAILAGMRAALEAVLLRFDPATLEQHWADKGVWENLRPVSHKAKLWDRFSEQHAETVRQIEDNFDSIFADAFAAAYEAQLAQLKRN
jgi:type VI secretion system FHA domain protein